MASARQIQHSQPAASQKTHRRESLAQLHRQTRHVFKRPRIAEWQALLHGGRLILILRMFQVCESAPEIASSSPSHERHPESPSPATRIPHRRPVRRAGHLHLGRGNPERPHQFHLPGFLSAARRQRLPLHPAGHQPPRLQGSLRRHAQRGIRHPPHQRPRAPPEKRPRRPNPQPLPRPQRRLVGRGRTRRSLALLQPHRRLRHPRNHRKLAPGLSGGPRLRRLPTPGQRPRHPLDRRNHPGFP